MKKIRAGFTEMLWRVKMFRAAENRAKGVLERGWGADRAAQATDLVRCGTQRRGCGRKRACGRRLGPGGKESL